jgi:hypothetical protein
MTFLNDKKKVNLITGIHKLILKIMAQLRGKYITMMGAFMGAYQNARKEVDDLLFAQTGKKYNELEPEGWYDTKWLHLFQEAYVKASPSKEVARVTYGRSIYPSLKRANLLPTNLKTALDFIKYEADGFKDSHKGTDVKPRKFIKLTEGDVIVEASAPGYNSKLYEGIYLGILEMLGIKTGKVVQTKSQEKGDSTSEFHITW